MERESGINGEKDFKGPMAEAAGARNLPELNRAGKDQTAGAKAGKFLTRRS